MRLPNGYGSVYKLSGKRRKPWVARVTTGWGEPTEDRKQSKQDRKIVGCYETKQLALAALVEYNNNPYSLESATTTFKELYEMWSTIKYSEPLSKGNISGYMAAYKTAAPLHDVKFVDIKAKDMQDVIRLSGKNYPTLRKLKVLFNQMFRFAMENDLVSKDYSQFVDIGKPPKETSRRPFTQEEIDRLFELVDVMPNIDTILIMIYTGLRISELLEMETKNVNLEEKTMTGGIKTEAGTDRIIPISDKILHLVAKRAANGYKYLISSELIKYDKYLRDTFKPIMKKLGFSHTPHDCRHTFATLMGDAGADTVALQKIIGHAKYETTANIYTKKDIEQLRRAIALI